ncbi:MAG: YbaK/EbsC family protein [bacterium]|jgi:Cys-tRNA(Pro) deacylase
MGLADVKKQFAEQGWDLKILEFEQSSATVDLAAQALGVEPARIAKTMALRVKEEVILVLAKGDARIDNRKFKDCFKAKARMLGPDEVLTETGHPVGGVCPFGLKRPLPVYLDASLREFDYVYPAAGTPNSAVRVEVEDLAKMTGGQWVEVCS